MAIFRERKTAISWDEVSMMPGSKVLSSCNQRQDQILVWHCTFIHLLEHLILASIFFWPFVLLPALPCQGGG